MTKRVISTMKSLLILALAILAVYQVSQLWFVNLTNRNFFLYLSARFPPATPNEQNAWARPFRVIYGAGDGRFNVRYSGIDGIATSTPWRYGENALDAIFRAGNFSRIIDEICIETRPVFIFEYAFSMCADTFARALGRRNGMALTGQGISTFDAIVVKPPYGDDGLLRVFLLANDRGWEFTMTPGNRQHPMEDFAISIPPAGTHGLYFVLEHGFFSPRIEGSFFYNPIVAHNPYLRDGNLHLSDILPQVQLFFGNPATILQSADPVYTFSNLNTTVRYLPTSVLEYTSFRTIVRTAPASLLSDFSAALAFIDRDFNVENDKILVDYEERGSQHIFWFDYVIDDFRIELNDFWTTTVLDYDCRDPLRAAIEIIVDHGRIVRYRRIPHSFRRGELRLIDPGNLAGEDFALGFLISRESVSARPAIEHSVFSVIGE